MPKKTNLAGLSFKTVATVEMEKLFTSDQIETLQEWLDNTSAGTDDGCGNVLSIARLKDAMAKDAEVELQAPIWEKVLVVIKECRKAEAVEVIFL